MTILEQLNSTSDAIESLAQKNDGAVAELKSFPYWLPSFYEGSSEKPSQD